VDHKLKLERQYYIGLMSGSSLDGIDAVLARWDGEKIHILATHFQSYPDILRLKLRHLVEGSGSEDPLHQFGQTHSLLGHHYAKAVLQLLAQTQVIPAQVAAIGCHGQTLRHCPSGESAYSLQAGDPHIVARLTGITTVSHFRQADMIAGGQGAPLAPVFHAATLSEPGRNTAVINIGGIANISIIDQHGNVIYGYDTGPGNALMNDWSQSHLNQPYDDGGTWASQHHPSPVLLDKLLSDVFIQKKPPKSSGRDYFHLSWLQKHIHNLSLSPGDIQASLCEFTARTIADAIGNHTPEQARVIICGGGWHNHFLVKRIRALCAPREVQSTESLGIDPDFVEAAAFAWLARCCIHQQPLCLKSVTGASLPSILGSITPAPPTLFDYSHPGVMRHE